MKRKFIAIIFSGILLPRVKKSLLPLFRRITGMNLLRPEHLLYLIQLEKELKEFMKYQRVMQCLAEVLL